MAKAPEAVAALYDTALTEYEYREWDENHTLARLCTWALADIGTAAAYEKLEALAGCDIPLVAGYAQKRIDCWQSEKSRKGI